MSHPTAESTDKKFHYSAIAAASVIILTILLGIGFWLLLTGNFFTDQTLLDPSAPAIVPASPDMMISTSPEAI